MQRSNAPTTRLFPDSLLDASIEEKLSFFKGYIVAHPKAEEALQRTLRYIFYPTHGYLLTVMGPAGSGKSVLMDQVAARLLERATKDVDFHPGRVPYAFLRSLTPDAREYQWPQFYRWLLSELHDIHIDQKISFRVDGYGFDGKPLVPANKKDIPKFASISALQHRNPYSVLIDEGHQFRYIAGSQTLRTQMDNLKDLSDLSKVVFSLFGTYEMPELTNLSAQLGRRTKLIPLSAYTSTPADKKAYFAIIRTLGAALPLPEPPGLNIEYGYLFDGSLGCIGLLKDWMLAALDLTLNNKEISYMDALHQTECSPKQLYFWAQEMIRGEEEFAKSDQYRKKTSQLLIDRKIDKVTNIPDPDPKVNNTPSTKRVTKPGRRGPHRDPGPNDQESSMPTD